MFGGHVALNLHVKTSLHTRYEDTACRQLSPRHQHKVILAAELVAGLRAHLLLVDIALGNINKYIYNVSTLYLHYIYIISTHLDPTDVEVLRDLATMENMAVVCGIPATSAHPG